MLDEILEMAIKKNASDINITSDEYISMRINRDLVIYNDYQYLISQYVAQDIIIQLTKSNSAMITLFNPSEMDGSYILIIDDKEYYFRFNIALSISRIHITIRKLIDKIYTVEEMNLDHGPGLRFLEKSLSMKEGLNLLVGATGSGKSTTLATIIDRQMMLGNNKVITLEAPIEYHFTSKRYIDSNSIIIQREVGIDTTSFDNGVRAAMRQNPDIIFIGEIRDFATANAAIQAANSGHVVMATLHAKSAKLGIERIKFLVGGTTNDWTFINSIMFQKLIKQDGKIIPERETLIDEEIYGELR